MYLKLIELKLVVKKKEKKIYLKILRLADTQSVIVIIIVNKL